MNIVVTPQYKLPRRRVEKCGCGPLQRGLQASNLFTLMPLGTFELAVDRMALEDYLTANEAAQRLRVHPETVKRLCRQGDLPAEKIRNTWLNHFDILAAFAGTYDPRPGARKRLE